jgi:hypothetical protein
MHLVSAVRSGCRIRHRDWPPYHYAELRPTKSGSYELCRVSPDGKIQQIKLAPEAQDGFDWKILDLKPE